MWSIGDEVIMVTLNEAPVRLCCGQRHYGVVCPDGMVMCCLCFFRIPLDDLAEEDGTKIDICKPCYTTAEKVVKLLGGSDE